MDKVKHCDMWVVHASMLLPLNSIPPPHLVPCLFVRWHRCSFSGDVLEFGVVLSSHIRQWVLYCVARPYHTILCCVAKLHQAVSSILCCQAISHSFVLCCQAASGSEFYIVLPGYITQFCVVLPSCIRQWVLLHKFELLECSRGHQNSDLCYEGKIILCWSMYSLDHMVYLWKQKMIFVAYEFLFQFYSLLFLAATDDENEIMTRTSWLDVSSESENNIFLMKVVLMSGSMFLTLVQLSVLFMCAQHCYFVTM
jgi:hypothetical protein